MCIKEKSAAPKNEFEVLVCYWGRFRRSEVELNMFDVKIEDTGNNPENYSD